MGSATRETGKRLWAAAERFLHFQRLFQLTLSRGCVLRIVAVCKSK